MKLGVVGKGGVGKTTVAALLAQTYGRRGASVVAIDTDSNPNLGMSLGLSLADTDAVPPLPRSLIVGEGGDATVDGVLSGFGVATPSGPLLLSAIRVNEAGGGCTCAGHASVRTLLGTALEEQVDVAIVDMEAGLEHLSRSGGTLAYADVLLVVMEPSRKSVVTAARTATLADELGIPRTLGLGNKARDERDVAFFRQTCAELGVELAGVLPYAPEVADADRSGTAVTDDAAAALRAGLDDLIAFLERVPVTEAARAGAVAPGGRARR